MEEVVKDYSGWILGYIEILPNGDKIARDFYKRILGYYKKSIDSTTDFYGRVICKGDSVRGLIPLKKQ